jgi:hypothetical protein
MQSDNPVCGPDNLPTKVVVISVVNAPLWRLIVVLSGLQLCSETLQKLAMWSNRMKLH